MVQSGGTIAAGERHPRIITWRPWTSSVSMLCILQAHISGWPPRPRTGTTISSLITCLTFSATSVRRRIVRALDSVEYPIGVPTSESQAHRVRRNQLVGSIFTTGIDTKLSPDLHTHLAGVTLPIFDATPNESEDSGDGHEIEKHASKISPNWQPTAAAALASVDAMRESNE